MKNRIALVLIAALLIPALSWGKIQLRPEPQLWVYASKSDLKSIKKLVANNPFDSSILGRALFHSLRRGSKGNGKDKTDIVSILLSYGANPNFAALNGQTPLMMAARALNEPVVKLLLENGADQTLRDARGRTARDFAAMSDGDKQPIYVLLEAPPEAKPVAQAVAKVPPKVQLKDLYEEGDNIVLIYDMTAEEPACVKAIGSMDGGNTYAMKFTNVSGDVGENVAAGADKQIIWQWKTDYPDGFGDADVLVDVVAEFCQ